VGRTTLGPEDREHDGTTPEERSEGRHVAPGGWRRVLVGFLVGLLAGAVVALVLPRDDGPRRRDLRATLPPPPEPAERLLAR
jgi:hypothetical protein